MKTSGTAVQWRGRSLPACRWCARKSAGGTAPAISDAAGSRMWLSFSGGRGARSAFAAIVLLSGLPVPKAPAQESAPSPAQEPAEVKALRLEYQHRLVEALTPADNWYRMQLRTRLEQYKRAGDLATALRLQSELENPDPRTPPPSDKPLPPDLAGIRSTYVVNAQRLTQPVEDWHRQQLEALRARYTREGRLADAQSIQIGQKIVGRPLPGNPGSAVSSETLLRPSNWKKPWGGRLRSSDGVLTLQGPGTAPFQMGFCITPLQGAGSVAVTGQISIVQGGGMVVAASDDGSAMLMVLVSKEGVRVFEMTGKAIRHLRTLSSDGPEADWQPFALSWDKSGARLRIGSKRHDVEFKAGTFGRSWGLATYDNFSVSLRGVSQKPD